MHSRAASFLLFLIGSTQAGAIHLNQVAFDATGPKIAIVEGPASLAGTSFKVLKDNQTAYTGTLGPAQNVADWTSSSLFEARFDQVTASGTYTLTVSDNGTPASAPFSIGTDALVDATLPAILSYFQADRSTSGDQAVAKYGSSQTRDVHGGWNDATGDVSKYLSHLSYANYMNPQQTPLSVWTLAFAADRIPSYLKSKSLLDKTRSEALWGADFLVRMQDPDGYFYITVFDGWNVKNTREICAFTGSEGKKTSDYQAAFREGAGMAIAALARVSGWNLAGEKSPSEYLATARKGYAHLKSKNTGGVCAYCDDGKENIVDDYTALLAATELAVATDSASYLSDARERAKRLAARVSSDGYFWSDDAKTRPFYHAADAGLPLVALVRYLEVDSAGPDVALVRSAASKHLSYLVRVTGKVSNPFGYARQTFSYNNAPTEGFFIPHVNETKYWWQGENARLGSLAAAAFYAGRFLSYRPDSAFGVPDSLSRYALSQLDWILGRNPKGLCFMAGVGKNQAASYYVKSNGHHRGGIVNGLTGDDAREDGTGIVYKDSSAFPANPPAWTVGPWMSWRWTEQWLPHSTWFLGALVAMKDEIRLGVAPPVAVKPDVRRAAPGPRLEWNGSRLTAFLREPASGDGIWRVSDLGGHVLGILRFERGSTTGTIELGKAAKGIVVVTNGLHAQVATKP